MLIIYLWLLVTKYILNSTDFKCSQNIKLYHFVRSILSIPFCPMPFCPYHFVRYHFVWSPITMAAMGNCLIKSHSVQTLSCTLWDTETVILLENFSFDLNNFFNLWTTLFVQRFLTFFYFFHKHAFFILGVNVYIYGVNNGKNESLDFHSLCLLVFCLWESF